ncbi:MAG: hypothetical protein ACOCRN_00420 [Spirochaetia bacterium]
MNTHGHFLRIVTLALLLGGVLGACSSNGASGEQAEAADSTVESGTLRGEVIDIATLSDGRGLLTVLQENDSEVEIELSERLASTLRIQVGDSIVVEDRHMERDGERLSVRNLEIERGQ